MSHALHEMYALAQRAEEDPTSLTTDEISQLAHAYRELNDKHHETGVTVQSIIATLQNITTI